MAIKVKAAGDGPNTGMMKSLPPVKPAAPDVVTAIRAPTRAGYGMNSFEGRSSTNPGETVTSPLSDNLKASSEDEGLLDRIARYGIANDGDRVDLQSPQTRPYSLDQKVPTAAGGSMKRQTAQSSKPGDVKVGTLPSTCGSSAAQPVRKPQ